MVVLLDNDQEVKNWLEKNNPTLSPDRLNKFFPKYNQYERDLDHFGIWQRNDFSNKINQLKNKFSKVLLLLSGVAGGGKDAIRETIEKKHPHQLFKVVTATSRMPRSDEQHKRDYYFYDDRDKFEAGIKQGEFIEHVIQGERLYGLPKVSLVDALATPSPIVCSHVEMSAWPVVSKFIDQEIEKKPFILRVFVMPQVKYGQYSQWLEKKREDVPARLARTHWELAEAPERADLLISNFDIDNPNAPFLEWHSDALVRHLKQVLSSTSFENFK